MFQVVSSFDFHEAQPSGSVHLPISRLEQSSATGVLPSVSFDPSSISRSMGSIDRSSVGRQSTMSAGGMDVSSPVITRPTRNRKPPQRFGDYVMYQQSAAPGFVVFV